MRVIVVALALAFFTGCKGVADLREGDLTVRPHVILAAGNSSDPALDAPLNAILERRIAGGYTWIDDARVEQAIRAQVRRRSRSAIPLFEQLVFDAAPEVQVQALAALGELGAAASLPVVARAALSHSRPETQEQAYHVVTLLTGVPVNFRDERELTRIVNQYGTDRPAP